MSQSLCFNDVLFDVIPQNSQPWVRGYQIGRALGYDKPEVSIPQLYTRHADEFTPAMTAVVTLPTEGGPQETRIFSLRGCHLLAMFARTPVAKQFRRWVLDVIEQYGDRVPVTQPVENPDTLELPSLSITPSSVADRAPLRSIVNAWARVSGQPFDACWIQLKAAFRLTDIRDLPQQWIPDAIAWVQGKIDNLPRPLPPSAPATPPAAPTVPALSQQVLSAELDRYAAEFETIASHVEQLPGLLQCVERVAFPLVSDACRMLMGSDRVRRDRMDAALTEMLTDSRRMADDLIPRARLGINIMRDLAKAQGR